MYMVFKIPLWAMGVLDNADSRALKVFKPISQLGKFVLRNDRYLGPSESI